MAMATQSDQELINENLEIFHEDEHNLVERRDSMEEDNKRGCDEIMLQFLSNLD